MFVCCFIVFTYFYLLIGLVHAFMTDKRQMLKVKLLIDSLEKKKKYK